MSVGLSGHLALVLMVLAYVVGAVLSLLAPSDRSARAWTAVGAAAGCLSGLAAALQVLVTRTPLDALLPHVVSAAGGVMVRLDLLGAFFLALVAAVSLPAAVYGLVYTAEYEGRCSLRVLGAMFNAFLLGMSLVPCAGNMFTFALAWELMAVASYFLVMTEGEHAETRRAGLWYAAMTHFGFVLVLPMFVLLAAGSPATTFADLRAGAAAVTPGARNAVFLLALAAFGSKAGVVPLHVWLPRAHPAAPSHVSALMSGVMIKLGIYGLIRVVFDFLSGGPAWWGGVLLAVGAASALLGVLYALMENDLKRLLAYSSVENIGIILIGLGAGAILQRSALPALAALGFAGALLHTLNHACFKALLFLGAGNVQQHTHTRNMEQLGGLIKRMPQTALLFLIGSAAIAALPPLNGFASEWLVFQSLLAGLSIGRPEIAVGFPIAVGMLALTSGLAAAAFVKAFGISFLAMPRSDHAAQATESHWSMRAMMTALAGACVVLGVAAPLIVNGVYRIINSVPGFATGEPGRQPSLVWLTVKGSTNGSRRLESARLVSSTVENRVECRDAEALVVVVSFLLPAAATSSPAAGAPGSVR
jgi:hydrogenase-4 component B